MQFRDILASIARTSLVLGAVSASALLGANDWNCCPQDCCPPQCCPQVCCDPAPECAWGFNPSAHLKCSNNQCCGFMDSLSGRVDFLWWRPCSEGLALGYEETFSSSSTGSGTVFTSETDTTSVQDLNFKFDPGFRLGLGYYCPCSCWDVELVWTHFHSKANATGVSDVTDFAVGDSELFYNYWTRDFGLFPELARARWTLDLDLVDLEFGQKYYVNHCFILRPHFGLRFARIDQNYHVDASSGSAFDFGPFASTGFASVVKAKNDFRGVGPRIGLDIEINVGCGFALFGKGAAALVYGEFDRNGNEALTVDGFGGGTSTTILTETYTARGHSDRCTVSMTDLAFGLKWEHCFECCNTYHPFTLAVEWDQNAFYDLNDFNFISGALSPSSGLFGINGAPDKKGHLTTQGLTVSACIGF